MIKKHPYALTCVELLMNAMRASAAKLTSQLN